MKWLAILNPAAHCGSGGEQLRCLARTLRQQLGAECVWTEGPEHAGALACGSQGFDGCIAVGGDGTIHEVVNGLDLKTQCLGIIPVGTGNGLARDLCLLDIATALQVLRRPRLAALDLLEVRYRVGQTWQERKVVHTSSLGYLAELVDFALGRLRWLGPLRYVVAACLATSRHTTLQTRLKIGDGPWQDRPLTNLVVNNTRYSGNFCLFPEARLQDGRLNLLYGCIPPQHQLLEDLGFLIQIYFMERSYRAGAPSVAVELAAPATLMLDGELVYNVDSVCFQVAPGALRVAAAKVPGLKLMEESKETARVPVRY